MRSEIRRWSTRASNVLLLIAAGVFPLTARCSEEVSTTPLVIAKGGTKESPEIFDGKGMVIDLAIDVSTHDWKKDGDIWTSSGPLLDRQPILAGQLAGLFIEEIPISIPRDVATEKVHPDRKSRCYFPPASLKPGQMGYADDGSLYFRWPAGKTPGSVRVLAPSAPNTCCVTIACSYITVRNITARHAANDGFNIHGKWVGIRLENVKAFSNADEGISAHDDVEMEVDGAEVAWNGSAAGGIADVNRCITRYRNCVVHDNLGSAFYFAGNYHYVSDTLIYNQSRDIQKSAQSKVDRERVEWKKTGAPAGR